MMEPIESDIEKAAGVVINENGFAALTLDALSRQMNISTDKLFWYIESNEDILKYLAQRLENEIQQLMHNIESMKHEPEQELTDLFKSLYNFFNRKSYFLELMFADIFHVNDNALATILIRVRQDIKNYLIQILEEGKKSGVFNYHMNTAKEADAVLDRFRFFMSDIPLTHKMIQDFKKIREKRE